MTKGLDKFFDLPPLEDILAETEEGEDFETEENEITVPVTLPAPVDGMQDLMTRSEMENKEHAREMDEAHDEMIKHARDMTELAFDLDPARAPRMLEVAGTYYKIAVDAKISKRDAQLKLMKLLQDQQKIDLDKARFHHELGNVSSERADVIMVEDRNTLLKRLKEEAAAEKKTED